MSDSSRLPARPSLEQLHKQAKDLLRQHRTANNPIKLADAHHLLAQQYGFESWPKLKHHVEALRRSSLDQFEKLAQDLAAAYSAGNATAIREINWSLGTSFIHDHDPARMQQRLPNWFAAEKRTEALALGDAQQIVAHAWGFESWTQFAESFAQRAEPAHRGPRSMSGSPPFYMIDWDADTLGVRGPQSDKDWDALCEIIQEHQLSHLYAGGMTDTGLERVARLGSITHLHIGNSNPLTDDGLRHLARMPQLEELDLSGVKGRITDRGLEVLRNLPELHRLDLGWQPNVSDAGVRHLAGCQLLERVNLMGTHTGDGAIETLAGKKGLAYFKTGREVTDAGLRLLHGFPVFKSWRGGEPRYGLMSADADPNHLMIDGPFTDTGIASLAGLEGLFGLSFFWHSSKFTGDGLEPLQHLPNLGMLGCEGERCNDAAMRNIAAIPRLRMLMAQGTVATDAGFEALSRSQSIEHIWGRECPNLTGRGFKALAAMPALRGIAVSCKRVDDASLALLPRFPALSELMPMDVSDDGFRHVGQCERLERLWCMYCRSTGDRATEHIAGLTALKSYYAGQTKITDRSLEMLGRMHSIEQLEFWACEKLTDAGVAYLTRLPRLSEISLSGSPKVTRKSAALFPPHVRVKDW